MTRLAALLLVAAFWWQGERFLAANGPTFDEPVHFAAGYSYWATGDFRLNLEDPPLAKLLWTLPQFLFDPLPFRDGWRTENEWRVGHALVFDSGHDWHALLTPARRMNLLFGVGVVVLVGAFARRLFDSRASGVLASALAAFDPNLVAHSCILSTDVSLTFCAVLTAWLAWEYVAGLSPCPEATTPHLSPAGRGGKTAGIATVRAGWTLTALGVAVGLTLGAKFSAVLVIGSVGIGLLAVLAAGGVVVMPGVVANPASFGDRLRLALPVVMRVTVLALLTLLPLYFVVRFPTWGEGLKYQLLRGDSGDTSFFLLGEISNRGWLWYFAVALAVKLPVGVIGLALLSLVPPSPGGRGAGDSSRLPSSRGGRRAAAGGESSSSQSPLPVAAQPTSPQRGEVFQPASVDRHTGNSPTNPTPSHPQPVTPSEERGTGLFLPVVAVTLFLAISLSRVNLGVRVVLPVLPFVYLLAARFVARPTPWRWVVAALAVGSVVVSAVRVSPYPLGYFNEFVGGPERGVEVLGDSNLDWGQGLPALKEYMTREKLEIVYLSYCGTAPPRAFGIECERLAGHGQLEPPPRVLGRGAPHVLVVGASNLQGTYLNDPHAFAWLRSRRPKTILAGGLWVFDVTADDEPVLRQLRTAK